MFTHIFIPESYSDDVCQGKLINKDEVLLVNLTAHDRFDRYVLGVLDPRLSKTFLRSMVRMKIPGTGSVSGIQSWLKNDRSYSISDSKLTTICKINDNLDISGLLFQSELDGDVLVFNQSNSYTSRTNARLPKASITDASKFMSLFNCSTLSDLVFKVYCEKGHFFDCKFNVPNDPIVEPSTLSNITDILELKDIPAKKFTSLSYYFYMAMKHNILDIIDGKLIWNAQKIAVKNTEKEFKDLSDRVSLLKLNVEISYDSANNNTIIVPKNSLNEVLKVLYD